MHSQRACLLLQRFTPNTTTATQRLLLFLLLLCVAVVGQLEVNLLRAPVEATIRLLFKARFSYTPASGQVRLYQSSQPGGTDTLLFPLVDDGSYSARDDQGGDGVFSNSLSTVLCSSEGDVYFTAIHDQLPALSERLHVKVSCVLPSTPEQINQSFLAAVNANAQLNELVAQGNLSPTEALGAIVNALGTTAGVDTFTLVTTGAGVTWQNEQGMRFRAFLSLPGQRAGPEPASPNKDPSLGLPYKPPAVSLPTTKPVARATASAVPGKHDK